MLLKNQTESFECTKCGFLNSENLKCKCSNYESFLKSRDSYNHQQIIKNTIKKFAKYVDGPLC